MNISIPALSSEMHSHQNHIFFRSCRLFALLLLLASLLTVHSARADEKAHIPYNSDENAVFALHKLSGTTPDFQSWAIHTDTYRDLPREERAAYSTYQTARLKKGFQNYDPRQNLLRVYLPARIIMPGSRDIDLFAKNDMNIPLDIVPEGFERGFFEFNTGNIRIAAMPAESALLSSFNINASTYETLLPKVGTGRTARGQNWHVNLEVLMRPMTANTSKTVTYDHQEYFTMLAEIASVTIHNKKNEYIWNFYQADWYKSKQETELLNLHRSHANMP